jgi:hypothetical protein
MKKRVVAPLTIAALWSSQSLAQSGAPVSDTELSKEAENPVTRYITPPLRYEADIWDGANKTAKDVFDIDQAVVPFRLNDDWSVITRTKLPAEVLPPKNLGDPGVAIIKRGPSNRGNVSYWPFASFATCLRNGRYRGKADIDPRQCRRAR